MQIFDEIKQRGVEGIFFISMDGVSGLEDGASSLKVAQNEFEKFKSNCSKYSGALDVWDVILNILNNYLIILIQSEK